MKKLARKLRNSDHDDKFALPIHEDDDARPLDSQGFFLPNISTFS
jgi:hypothetical protein